MDDLESAIRKLVAANRILAVEGVVDAFGHISSSQRNKPKVGDQRAWEYLCARARIEPEAP